MDLDNLKPCSAALRSRTCKTLRPWCQLFRALYEFPKLTIAAVNGRGDRRWHGTGFCCATLRLAVPDAKFGYTEVRIGFVPAIVSTFLLRQVGEKQARDLLLTGRFLMQTKPAHGAGQRNRTCQRI